MGRDRGTACPAARGRRFNPRARVGRDAWAGQNSAVYGSFQSTRPRGARPVCTHIRVRCQPFQSTRPRGARHVLCYRILQGKAVSIHAPAWGATSGNHCFAAWAGRFQSTRPRGARRVPNERGFMGYEFQSTRPRGARPGVPSRRPAGLQVSIHAPAWGATTERRGKSFLLCVSIHAPAWGATQQRPTSDKMSDVSIHAPAWGATAVTARNRACTGRFNPRARVGRDQVTRSCSRYVNRGRFNPRARVGRDPATAHVRKVAIKFQSTRPRGARQVEI